MRQRLLFIWLALLFGVAGANAKDAYAYYMESDHSLNFCYDDSKSERSKSYPVYSLNTGTNTPAWNSIASQIQELYFYSSFADYKPTSCHRWADGMSNLTRVRNISYLNTSNVTKMDYMFRDCSKLESLDVSTFNTQNVTDMYAMFSGCSKLTSLNVSGWSNNKVTDMTSMFSGCSILTSLNLSNFMTPNVTSMSCMFLNCKKLTSINVSGFNTSNVFYFYRMFDGCSSLTSLDLSNFNASKVTETYGLDFLINGCNSLRSLTLSSSMATSTYYTNYSCGGVGTTSSPCVLYYPTSVHPSFSSITPDYVVWKGGYFKSNNMHAYALVDGSTLTFKYDDWWTSAGASTIWNIKTGEEAPGWKTYASNITKVVFSSSFQNARPTSCYEWFDGMSNLTTITGMSSYLNTSKVTNMKYMFFNCGNLASVDVSGFNTANVTNMSYMFDFCSSLTSLNISNFNLSSLSYSSGMIMGCTALKTLTIPSTASKLASDACSNVGTTSSPCTLSHSNDFTPIKEATGDGWFKWKNGYFLDDKAYANLSSDKKTLTFYCDKYWQTRAGYGNYSLNTGANAPGWHSYASSVTSVVFNFTFMYARPTSCYEWFDGMTNLTYISNMSSYLNTSQVTNMRYMFYNCGKLGTIESMRAASTRPT